MERGWYRLKKMEAHIVLSRCLKCTKKLYGIRMEKQGELWKMTWSFPIDEKKAKSEGYDRTTLSGVFTPTSDYNGCPYCKAKTFLSCPKCTKVTCYYGEEYAECAWCGLSGKTKTQDHLSLTGGTM